MTRRRTISLVEKNRQKKLEENRIKAVSTPKAQYATLCRPGILDERLLNSVLFNVGPDSPAPYLLRVLIDLQVSGGLRISECLNQRELKVTLLGQVLIRGSKGSQDKLVTPIFFPDYWRSRAGIQLNPFINLTRFSVYKLYKKYGIQMLTNGDSNNLVTHSLRHLSVHLNQMLDLSDSELSRILGHKSLTAIKFYKNGKTAEN